MPPGGGFFMFFLMPQFTAGIGEGTGAIMHMLGTKLDWLCNAIVALVIVLALGLVLTKPQDN